MNMAFQNSGESIVATKCIIIISDIFENVWSHEHYTFVTVHMCRTELMTNPEEFVTLRVAVGINIQVKRSYQYMKNMSNVSTHEYGISKPLLKLQLPRSVK